MNAPWISVIALSMCTRWSVDHAAHNLVFVLKKHTPWTSYSISKCVKWFGPAAKAPPVAPSGTAKWPLPRPCWRCATACGFRICPATVKLSPWKTRSPTAVFPSGTLAIRWNAVTKFTVSNSIWCILHKFSKSPAEVLCSNPIQFGILGIFHSSSLRFGEIA